MKEKLKSPIKKTAFISCIMFVIAIFTNGSIIPAISSIPALVFLIIYIIDEKKGVALGTCLLFCAAISLIGCIRDVVSLTRDLYVSNYIYIIANLIPFASYLLTGLFILSHITVEKIIFPLSIANLILLPVVNCPYTGYEEYAVFCSYIGKMLFAFILLYFSYNAYIRIYNKTGNPTISKIDTGSSNSANFVDYRMVANMKKIKNLYDSGIITTEEFEQKKTELQKEYEE